MTGLYLNDQLAMTVLKFAVGWVVLSFLATAAWSFIAIRLKHEGRR